MKTKFDKTESYTNAQLFEIAKEIITNIKSKVDNTKYEGYKVFDVTNGDLNTLLISTMENDLGINDYKRFKRIINACVKKRTINSYNKLLRFVGKKVVNAQSLKIKCVYHEEVQKLKKVWIAKKQEEESALNAYKLFKNNFYKNIKFNTL